MASLIHCADLVKSFGVRELFSGICLSVFERERIGVLGPNGAGKSTLLKILAGQETPDAGTVTRQKNLHFAYLPQEECFAPEKTIQQILEEALGEERFPEEEIHARIGEVRSVVGIESLDQTIASLSGGWRKRVAIAAQLILQPDVLLLDEPTNHLDLEGILWLERYLKSTSAAVLMISHDRALLENSTSRIFEVNRLYPQGFFTVDGNYSKFLEKREEFLQGVARYEDSLRNKVRREIEWLRRGAKARTTKAKGRIQEAERLQGELAEYQSRSSRSDAAEIDFAGSGRRTKKLIAAEKISKALGGNTLFRGLDVTLSPGMRIGVVGPNGSGKSSLLRVLLGDLDPDEGTVTRASDLRIVTFDQNRAALSRELSVKRVLAPEGDTVFFRDQPIHVAGWAKRFLFRPEQLDMPVSALSGGEQARLLIARLMLQTADVLLLDEPTNDLDIETLQMLEESLEEFPGAVMLITHDRFLLDRVSTTVLGLLGNGDAKFFASYTQWEEYRSEQKNLAGGTSGKKNATETQARTNAVKKLSYKEQRELSSLEESIAELESRIATAKAELEKPEVSSDSKKLSELCESLAHDEVELEKQIHRWTELEEKR